jgi:hypothetical protein
MKKLTGLKRKIGTMALITFCLLFLIVGFSGNYGVSNMDSLHLSDFNGTATPNFLVNQRGSGVIAEFQDGGTPIATWSNGGSFVSGGAMDLNGQQLIMDADGDTSLTADTDDQIDIEIAGADDFVFTANLFESQTGSVIDLNGTQLTIDADADTTMISSVDDIITFTIGAATGGIDIATGNLKVGDGTPTFTQDGEDAYIEGAVEFGSDFVAGAQSTIVVNFTTLEPITPTGFYQPVNVTTASSLESDVISIAAPTDDTIGKQLIIHNIDSTDVITIDGTGTTVECKADIALAAQDTLTLLWNGDDWICISNYDNS